MAQIGCEFCRALKAVLQKAAAGRMEALAPEPGMKAMTREALCAKYGCGIALVAATQDKEVFYLMALTGPSKAAVGEHSLRIYTTYIVFADIRNFKLLDFPLL